jgi:hypothetical protein
MPDASGAGSLTRDVGLREHAMRILGYILLVGGFLWLAEDSVIGFTDYQYASGLGFPRPSCRRGTRWLGETPSALCVTSAWISRIATGLSFCQLA